MILFLTAVMTWLYLRPSGRLWRFGWRTWTLTLKACSSSGPLQGKISQCTNLVLVTLSLSFLSELKLHHVRRCLRNSHENLCPWAVIFSLCMCMFKKKKKHMRIQYCCKSFKKGMFTSFNRQVCIHGLEPTHLPSGTELLIVDFALNFTSLSSFCLSWFTFKHLKHLGPVSERRFNNEQWSAVTVVHHGSPCSSLLS